MRDGWHRVALGQIAEHSEQRVTVEEGVEYPAVGVLRDGMGLFPRAPFVGGQTGYRWLNRLQDGQVVLRSITAWEAPIAVVPHEFEGWYVSQVFPTLTLDGSRLLPQYMRLVCQWPSFWDEMRLRAQGTVLRRKTLSARQMLDIPISLPPLAEQRRIVDLARSCESALSRAAQEVRSAQHLLAGLREKIRSTSVETVVLDDIATLATGPSWKASQETQEWGDGRLPVIGITNTPYGGQVDLSHLTYVSGLPAKTRKLDPSAVLLIRTNGNRGRIGNAYRVPAEATGYAFSAFQTGVFPYDPEDSAYLFHALSATSMQERISEAASGSTGLGNIAISWLRCLELPWPEEYERRRAAEVADAAGAVASAAQAEHQRLNRLRSILLDELLSGRRAIPESYDRLLDAAS